MMHDPTAIMSTLYSFGELMRNDEQKRANFAHCTAIECAGVKGIVFKENVTDFRRRCPDCGNALTWRRTLGKKDKRKMERGEWVG